MKLKKRTMIGWGIGITALALSAAACSLAYFSKSADPLSKSLKSICPSAIAGSRFVTIKEKEDFYKFAERLPDQAKADEAFERYLTRLAILDQLKIGLDADELADEAAYLTRGKEPEYRALVNEALGGDADLFNRFIVSQSLAERKLKEHYNQNSQAGNAALQRANEILSGIAESRYTFEDAAKNFSDDEYTGQIGGDLGFFGHGELIPELEKPMVISALGKAMPVPILSRFGYHLLYPVELSYSDGKKLWHAKHILIAPEGYDEWIEREAGSARVYRFGK